MKSKISLSDLSSFANVSTRTLIRWKKSDLKKYDRLLKQYQESDLFSLRSFLKENKIELMGNFGIYFTDIDDYSVGILAEDTNFLISKKKKSDKELREIKKNLRLLKEWL